MTFSLLRLLDLHFRFDLFSHFIRWKSANVQWKVIRTASEGWLIVSFEGTTQTCETLHAIESALAILEDPSGGEMPEVHSSRYTGCSALPSVLPGGWCMPIKIFYIVSHVPRYYYLLLPPCQMEFCSHSLSLKNRLLDVATAPWVCQVCSSLLMQEHISGTVKTNQYPSIWDTVSLDWEV